MKRFWGMAGVVALFLVIGNSAYALDCSAGQKIADKCKDIKDNPAGCCSADGKTSTWCEVDQETGEEALCYMDCSEFSDSRYAKCGWNPHFGYYDCYDDGADPTGSAQMACPDCTPQCDGKECGYDGCYGICGTCDEGKACVEGKCVECTCDGKECGADQCGNPCGTCSEGMACQDGTCVTNSPLCDTHDSTAGLCGETRSSCSDIQDCVR
jgi:hypothetical protein